MLPAAGDLARSLRVPQNTLSSHLLILVNAGLVTSRRDGRSIIYSIHLAGTRRLLSFLMEVCCQGGSEVCTAALESMLPACCASLPKRGENHEKTAC